MSKGNRLYKIFMTSMIVIIAGLLLACGVIAVKNSMRVKMSIPANPNFLIEIYIQKDGSETQNLVFKNFDEIKIQNGISGINANTLIASDDFVTQYGGDFSIIIKNYTTTMGILASITSTATMDGDVPGVPAEITAEKAIAAAYDTETKIVEEVEFHIANKAVFPQQTLLEIKFEELTTLDVSLNAENTSTGDVETIVEYGSVFSQTLTAQEGYVFDENITVAGVKEGGYSWTPNGVTGVFTITDWSKVTGPIAISVNAVKNVVTISYAGVKNLNWENQITEITPNTAYSTTFTATNENDFTLPEIITINIGGTNYEVPKNGSVNGITYSVGMDLSTYIHTGTLSIPLNLANGDVAFNAEGYIDYWDGVSPTTLETAGGNGTGDFPYLIANGRQLASVASTCNAGNSYSTTWFKLIKNIYLNEGIMNADSEGIAHPWTPIGETSAGFEGYLLGNNLDISGIYINSTPDTAYSGLFGFVLNEDPYIGIDHFSISSSYIKGGVSVGAVAGHINSQTTNVTIKNDVTIIGQYAGGICGTMSVANLGKTSGCVNYGAVEGTRYAGGICGELTGGLLFSTSRPWVNCKNYGKITGAGDIGAITGYFSSGTSDLNAFFETCEWSTEFGGPSEPYGGVFID